MKKWKAWYDNKRTFSSEEHKWEELPDDGVLAVLVFEEKPYTRYTDGQDFYFMYKGTICANNDTLETNKKRYPNIEFKRGKWTSDEEMKQVQKEAQEEADKWQ